MSLPLIEDFDKRREQVKRYLAVVTAAERQALLGPSRKIDLDRLHILRAGTFLILYNLIEASARGALEAIHDDMAAKRIKFNQLSPILRREVVKGFKRKANPDKHTDLTDLPVDFVSAALDVDYHFSGNVDSKLIRKIADLYGFSTYTDGSKTNDGADLLQIKSNRNDLAHGDKTYDEVGRNVTARDLIGVSLRSTAFMRQMLENVKIYVSNQGYLLPD